MHLNLKSVILSLLILSSFFSLRAQDFRPGYIIKNNLDSIPGYVAYKSKNRNGSQCEFKKTKRGERVVFSTTDLKGFGFVGDKSFEVVTLPKNSDFSGPVFAEVIVKGILSLHRVAGLFVVSKDEMVILPSPKNKNIYNTEGRWYKKDKRYVGLLNSLIRDCELSADESSYTEEDLTDLVVNYNRCKGSTVPYRKARPIVGVDAQIFTGFSRSNLSMDLHEDVTFSPSNTVIGAIAADFSAPRVFDRIFLSLEVWYISSFYQAYAEGPYNGTTRYQDIFLDVSYFKIPIGIKYNFLKEGNTPYVKAGFSLSAVNDISIRTFEEKETPDGTVYSNEHYLDYVFRSPRSLWAGAGYEKRLTRKLRLFGELRFEHGSGFIGTKIQSFSKLSSFNILAGIRF
jgi:hypothetical protein